MQHSDLEQSGYNLWFFVISRRCTCHICLQQSRSLRYWPVGMWLDRSCITGESKLINANKLPKLGDRIVVHGIRHIMVKVSKIEWNEHEARYVIALDWGEHGTSKVYDHDEGKTWYRYNDAS